MHRLTTAVTLYRHVRYHNALNHGLFPVAQLYTTVPLECHRRAAGIEVRLMASSMNPLMFVKP